MEVAIQFCSAMKERGIPEPHGVAGQFYIDDYCEAEQDAETNSQVLVDPAMKCGAKVAADTVSPH
jgi:hypothetical protein